MDLSNGHNIIPSKNPMSILNAALLSIIILTVVPINPVILVAHAGRGSR